MESLDSILKGKSESPSVATPEVKPVETQPEAEAAKVEEPTQAERDRDEKGRFKAKAEAEAKAKADEAAKVETKPAPTAVEKTKETQKADAEQQPPAGHVPVKGLIEERRKRQEAERLLAEHLARQQQPQQQEHSQQQTPPGVDLLWDMALNTSEIAARDKYGDEKVDEAQSWFLEQSKANPALYASLRQQCHPYKWVIQQFQQSRLLQEIGDDPDAYREKLKSQLRAEWEAENAQRVPQQQARPAPVVPPPSLASATSTGPVSGKTEWGGPTPLTNVFRR